MPVRRRRGYYGENPEQAQLPAQGFIPVEKKTSERFSQAQLPGIIRQALRLTPALGYTWEILNLNVTCGFWVEVKTKIEPVFFEARLRMKIGSQEIFSILKPSIETQYLENVTPEIALYGSTFSFTESPPIPLSIPGGQQIELILEVPAIFPKNKESKIIEMRLFLGSDVKNELHFNDPPQSSSFITYRYS